MSSVKTGMMYNDVRENAWPHRQPTPNLLDLNIYSFAKQNANLLRQMKMTVDSVASLARRAGEGTPFPP